LEDKEVKGTLDIELYWLCFQKENSDGIFLPQFEKSLIKWKGTRTSTRDEKSFSHNGDAKDIASLVSQLKSYFGSDLMDLNNECYVRIINESHDSLEKGNQMATGKYCIHEKLSFKEKSELGILLNSILPS
jgi:hypothetical protein